MAQMPIEVVIIGTKYQANIDQAIKLANTRQNEFLFSEIDNPENYLLLDFDNLNSDDGFMKINAIRKKQKGYHPFIVAIVDASLSSTKATNLFAESNPNLGISITSTNNIENIILQSEQMTAYFLYYFAGHLLRFIVPDKKNHDDTKECVYDFKANKSDIMLSMKSGAFCDDCRKELLAKGTNLSSQQFNAINKIFGLAGQVVREEMNLEEKLPNDNKAKIILDNDAKIFAIVLFSSSLFITLSVAIALLLIIGWDKFEPLSYIIGLGITFLWYALSAITLKTSSPLEFYHQILKRRKEKLYKKFNI